MTKLEAALEILDALDIPIEETATYERFKEYIERELGPSEPRVQAIWTAVEQRFEELAPKGVRPVVVEYKWGRVLRWAIRGYPGLWGTERMIEITGWKPRLPRRR